MKSCEKQQQVEEMCWEQLQLRRSRTGNSWPSCDESAGTSRMRGGKTWSCSGAPLLCHSFKESETSEGRDAIWELLCWLCFELFNLTKSSCRFNTFFAYFEHVARRTLSGFSRHPCSASTFSPPADYVIREVLKLKLALNHYPPFHHCES